MKRLIAFSIDHPVWVLTSVLLLSLAVALSLWDLRVDLSLEQFVASDDALTRRYRELGERFGRPDRTLTVLWTDERLFSDSGAAAFRELAEAFEGLPWVNRVDSLANAQLAERDPLFDVLYPGRRIGAVKMSPALGAGSLQPGDWTNLRDRVRAEPLYRPRLLSADGKTAVLVLWLNGHYDDARDRQVFLAEVSRILESSRRPHQSFLLTGSPPTRQAYLELITQDARRVLPAILIVFALFLGLTLKHWLGCFVTFSVAALSLYWTLVFQSFLGRPISPLSIALPVILTFVAGSDSIHLFYAYRRSLRDKTKRLALYAASLQLNRALALTSITTAAGFLALTVTGVPVLRDFGLIAALGVLIAYGITLTAGLGLLSLFLAPPPLPRGPRGKWWGPRRAWPLAAGSLIVVSLLAFLGVPRLRVESLLVDDVRPTHPIRQTRREVEARLGGSFPLTLLIHGPKGTFDDPRQRLDFASRIEDFQQKLARDAPDFLESSVSPAGIYLFFWRAMSGSDRLPLSERDWKRLDAVARSRVEEAFPDWKEGVARIEARVFDRGTSRTFGFLDRTRAAFDSIFGSASRLEFQGFVYLAQEMQRRVVGQSARGFLLGLLAVGLVLILLLRSRLLVLAAILVNVLPALAVLSLMGLLGIEMRISSSIVFSIVLGVCVDDTIHLLASYQRQCAARRSVESTLLLAVQEVAPGILSTSLVMAAGFLTLELADFTPARVTGELLAFSVLAAMVADLFVLPALIGLMSEKDPAVLTLLDPKGEPPRLVCWDMDGTLYSRRAAAASLLSIVLRQTFRGRPPAGLLKELGWLWTQRRSARGSRRSPEDRHPCLSPPFFWILKAIGIAGPRPGVFEVLDYFESRGTQQVVYSDHPAQDKLAALNLDAHFSAVYAGDQMGAVKPSPRGLLRVAADFHLNPDQLLVIGDREDRDGEAAVLAGSACLLLGRDFTDFESLRVSLSRWTAGPEPGAGKRSET